MGVTHKNVGNELTYTEYHAADSHIGAVGGNALVVAAADTPTVLKDRADYVCTGTSATGGDQTTINTALGAAGAVVLCPGTFWVSGSIVIAARKSLVGSGSGTIIKVRNSHNADLNVITATSVDHVLVTNLRVDGNKTNQTTGLMVGIYFNNTTHSMIARCWTENLFTGEAILLDSSNNNIVTSNDSQSNGRYGIVLYASNNNAITGNNCQSNDYEGIYLYNSKNNTITGNNCQSNAANGIVLYECSNNNTVTGNNCQSNDYNGIFLTQASSNNAITGNNCKSNGRYGIILYVSDYNTVTGNAVIGNSQETDNTYNGIHIAGNSNYNNVQGNTVRHAGGAKQHQNGISIDSSDCDGNLVTNNDLYLSGKTGSLHNAGTGTVTAAGNRL